MLTQNQGQPWTPSTAPLGVSADAEQAERQKVVAQVRAIMATPEQSREFPADGDPAQWARSIMAVAERQPVEQTFLRGLEQGWVGTAGTLARSARLPYEAGKAALEWLGLDKEDLATVEVALRAITPGSFAVGDYLEGRGQALQEQAALLGQTFEKETMLGGVGQAFGSAFAMAPAAVVGGAVAPALGVSAALGGAVAGGATGVALSSEGLLERAEALGASPGQKLGAMAAGVPIGAVEAFGAQRFLGALGKVFGAGSKEVQRRVAFEIAKAAARSGAEEGLEEVAQGMGEEAVAQFILEDPEKNGRSLTEWAAALEDTVVDQGFPGAVVGMVLGGMARAGTLTQAVKEAEQKPAVAAQEPKPEPAAEDDAERANAPEWAGPLEAMAKQNNARLRYVKPSNDAQRQAMRIAEDLGVEVGFVDVAPDPAGSGQLPGQTAPAAAAVDVAPPDVATDTAADMREPGEDAAPVEAGPPKSIRDRMADRKALAQDGSLGFRNWVRSMGGLNAGKSGDVGAEIREGYSERESGEGAKWGLGPLVHSDRSDKGMSLDGLLEAAMEAGFVPQGSGIQDVLDLLESDVTPQSAQYQAERDLAAEAELFDRELERERKARGLPPGTTAQDIADIDAFTGDAPPFAASPTGGLKFPAAYMNGRVVLDARSATPKRLLFHEGLHHIAANNPEGFARLLSAMTDMRPEKIAAARRAYAEAFGEGAPEGAALDEEAAAVFSEDLAGVLETAFTDTTKLARVLQDRNVFEVVRDWIARLARTLGGSMQTTMERRLAAAVAADNAEVQLALLWKDAVDMIQAEQRSRDAVEAVEGDAKFAAAYHGTPHDFDRFTTEKIGTGEGAQAYGWGLYFASAKEVAESYRKKLTNPGIRLEQVARDSYNSDMETDEAEAAFLADVDASPGLTANERALVAQAKLDGWYGFDYPHQAIKAVLGKDAENYDLSPEIRPILDAIKAERRGRLYEVELAPADDEFLLWDEREAQQSEKVRAGLGRVFGEMGFGGTGEFIYKELSRGAGEQFGGGSPRLASLALRAAGIRGIKYLDGMSRGAGDGSYNYVIFDEADVSVRAKFALDPSRVAAAQAQAQAEGEPTEVGTRPSRIADTSDDPEARAFRRGVREVRAENEEVLSLEEQRRRADELLKDPNAEADLSAKIETGDVLKGHEQLAFDTLRTRRTMAALKSGDMASIRRGIETEKLYEDMRRDTARALGVIRDALNEPTPQRLVSEFAFKMSPDLELRIERATKKLDEARAKGNADRVRIETATIERLKGIEAERVQKAIAALKAQGIDPALITSAMLEDPAVAARVARTIYTAKSPKFDWYKEYLISAMLSATGTQVVNATGNVLNAGVEQHATRLAKAMVNTVVRDQNSPSWDETYAFYKAWNVAAMKAGQVFLRSMRTDMPVFEIELRNQGVVEPTTQGQKLDVGRAAIPGMMGRIVRAPSLTMIRATDESARAFSFVTEGTALAFRAAKKEGLTGDALAKRTIEILEGPARPDVHGAALEMADHMTFRDPDGFATQAFLEVRKRLDTLVGTERHGFFPLGTHIAPFVSFAAKSLRAAVGLPVHPAVTLLRLAGRVGGKGPYVGDKSKMVDDLARTMVSSAIMIGLYALVGREDDDGLPYITGSARPGERDVFPPPMSVRVGGNWYSYERLDPASTSIALLVDGIRTGQDEDSVAAGFAKGMQSLGMVVANKSYLQTLGTIVDAISEPDAERWQNRLARYVARTLITPLVPNIIRSTASATDPFERTPAARKSAEDDGVWDVVAAELDYRVLPTGARAPAAKYDLWGRPLERPGRGFFERLLSPVKTTGEAEDATDFDVLIWRYNQRFERGEIDDPEARRFRTRQPDYHYTGRDGEKRYWTGPEYEALQQRAGQEAFERLQRQRFNFDAPTWDDVERIRKTVSEARSRVKRSLLREVQEPQFAER
jgi:hypothetical protein